MTSESAITSLNFSIVIPAKNEEFNIAICLRSIFSINYPKDKYEVFVIDNGSDDNTTMVAESMGAQVVRLPDVNIAALRNYGARLARGKVLAFLDADCTVTEDWLEQASRYLSREDVVLFGSPPGIPRNSTWVQQTWLFVRGRTTEKVSEVAWLESMNMFIPRLVFWEIGGFKEELVTCEDVDISYRLATYGKIISDLRIKAIHHGEARTISEFFFKEKWRGKSNYQGVIQHGLKIKELPSLVLPLYVFGMLFSTFLSAVFSAWQPAMIALGGAELPIAALAWKKIRYDFDPVAYCRLLFLYNVYFVARAASLLPGRY